MGSLEQASFWIYLYCCLLSIQAEGLKSDQSLFSAKHRTSFPSSGRLLPAGGVVSQSYNCPWHLVFASQLMIGSSPRRVAPGAPTFLRVCWQLWNLLEISDVSLLPSFLPSVSFFLKISLCSLPLPILDHFSETFIRHVYQELEMSLLDFWRAGTSVKGHHWKQTAWCLPLRGPCSVSRRPWRQVIGKMLWPRGGGSWLLGVGAESLMHLSSKELPPLPFPNPRRSGLWHRTVGFS